VGWVQPGWGTMGRGEKFRMFQKKDQIGGGLKKFGFDINM
jgi:hypothetical protein